MSNRIPDINNEINVSVEPFTAKQLVYMVLFACGLYIIYAMPSTWLYWLTVILLSLTCTLSALGMIALALATKTPGGQEAINSLAAKGKVPLGIKYPWITNSGVTVVSGIFYVTGLYYLLGVYLVSAFGLLYVWGNVMTRIKEHNDTFREQ